MFSPLKKKHGCFAHAKSMMNLWEEFDGVAAYSLAVHFNPHLSPIIPHHIFCLTLSDN
jgi:hypothetical protein